MCPRHVFDDILISHTVFGHISDGRNASNSLISESITDVQHCYANCSITKFGMTLYWLAISNVTLWTICFFSLLSCDFCRMIHGLRIKDGNATYVSRYVRTSRLKQEEAFGGAKFQKVYISSYMNCKFMLLVFVYSFRSCVTLEIKPSGLV